MLILLYHFLWTLVLVFCLPLAVVTGNRRFLDRLALRLPPPVLSEGTIWIHALSVGEVISALPLVDGFRARFPSRDIVFTVTTSKGMTVAERALAGKVGLLTMPVDCWWSVRRVVNLLRPSVFVLVETDIWPALLRELKKRGARRVLVNGRISPRTFRSYRRFAPLARILYEGIEACLMQSAVDRDRLLEIGVEPRKVVAMGNIKFDRNWVPLGEEERQYWERLIGLNPYHEVWVSGSTHPGEEKILLEVFKRLRSVFVNLHLILAPRKIERSAEVRRMARDMGFQSLLKTELPKGPEPPHVVVLNTLGDLSRVYGLGKVSFVGGSLVPFGGHNLLEPASFGAPVVFGPHTHNFEVMSELLVEIGGGWRVRSAEELYRVMTLLLQDSQKCRAMGGRAKAFVEHNHGALERVTAFIQESL